MKTLVVRPGALGDTLLTLPFLDTIAKQDPCGTLSFLGTRAYLPLIPAYIQSRPLDDISSLWLFSESPGNIPVQELVFDIAYLILHSPGAIARNLIRSGTKNVKIVSPQGGGNEHIVRVLHRHAGLPVPIPRPALQHLAPKETLSAVWMHPGSGGPEKCAPLSIFLSVSKLVRTHYRLPIVVTASNQDAFLMRQHEWRGLVEQSETRLLINRPIEELCHELGGAVLFVGNDSGIAHLAAGLGVKCLLFFCRTDPRRWAPWVSSDQMCVVDCRDNMPSVGYLGSVLAGVLGVGSPY